MSYSGKVRISRVYLDVETYRPEKRLDFIGEDIILIGLLPDEDEKEEPIFFENFEREREKEVLKELYEYLNKKLEKNTSALEIVGFSILRYDIPLIISKSLKHGVVREVFNLGQVHEAERLSKFWHNIYIVDLQQILLPLNKMKFKNLSLKNAQQMLSNLKCKISSQEYEEGEMIKEWYERQDYDKIREKNKKDLKAIRDIYHCIKNCSQKRNLFFIFPLLY